MITPETTPDNSDYDSRFGTLVDAAGFPPQEALAIISGTRQLPHRAARVNEGRQLTPYEGAGGRDIGLQVLASQEIVQNPVALSEETTAAKEQIGLLLRRRSVARHLLAGEDPVLVRARDKARQERRSRA